MKNKTENSEIYSRNELIWGEEAQAGLFKKHVAIFGLGGVGAYAADALARSGVGELTLVDFDTVSASNINRQLLALLPDVGKQKTDLMKDRIEQINPHIKVNTVKDFYTKELNPLLQDFDYVLDAIDTLKYKIELIKSCKDKNIPIISSMGAGNRLDPSKLYIADISEVKSGKCPFIKNVLSKLKAENIKSNLPVVTSFEHPQNLKKVETNETINTQSGEVISITKFTPASVPFVPPVAGYFMASYVVNSFIKEMNELNG